MKQNVHAWARAARPGDRLVYWASWECPWEDVAAALSRGSAMEAYIAGLVCLVQRRIRSGAHEGHIQYEAVRRYDLQPRTQAVSCYVPYTGRQRSLEDILA